MEIRRRNMANDTSDRNRTAPYNSGSASGNLMPE
jgi:hypothetical protein